jgi:hypothetical protein
MRENRAGPGEATRDAIRGLLSSTLSGQESGLPREEADALTNVCMMGVAVKGDENPREMVRPISDAVLDRIVENRDSVVKNPVVGRVYQIFFIEWCYRRGHLECDWAWKWERPGEGKLYYRSKQPLEKILATALARRTPG